MPDIPSTLVPAHNAIRREDYRPPDWLVPEIALEVELDPDRTPGRATLGVTRNGSHDRPLRLDGDELAPLEVLVDGGEARWSMDGPTLVVMVDGDSATIETLVELAPAAHTNLMGLYASGGLLCTQCESEGFRRITCFPDCPDVLSRYRVRMSADAARFPVLLANGNQVASGAEGDATVSLSGGQAAASHHWAVWEDPFPKPSYLFALVAGDLAPNRDHFTTMSGRKVDLAIWARAPDLPKTA